MKIEAGKKYKTKDGVVAIVGAIAPSGFTEDRHEGLLK